MEPGVFQRGVDRVRVRSMAGPPSRAGAPAAASADRDDPHAAEEGPMTSTDPSPMPEPTGTAMQAGTEHRYRADELILINIKLLTQEKRMNTMVHRNLGKQREDIFRERSISLTHRCSTRMGN